MVLKLMYQWKRLQAISEHLLLNERRSSIFRESDQHLFHDGIKLDYSRQNIPPQVFEALNELARTCNLAKNIEDYFSGKAINTTEERAALHTALRAPFRQSQALLGLEVADDIQQAIVKMQRLSHAIRTNQWLGYHGSPIKNIVHIGMGGSDLGPKMSVYALKEFKSGNLNVFFISDADPSSFDDTVAELLPDETLFIVASKSFTTKETLHNASRAIKWLDVRKFIPQHFIAVTARPELARDYGFTTVLPIWDWVGGRFSLCSSVNFVLMLLIGVEQFNALLEGAHAMDEHFRTAEFEVNLAVKLALIGIWNVNFRHISSHAVMVYNSRLKYFPPYLQQLEMESNGKSIDKRGARLDYPTCPIIWGGIGNQAEHAYYQLLSQGSHKVSLDAIFDQSMSNQLVVQSGRAKIDILSQGRLTNDSYHIDGEQPINLLTLAKLTPYTLGALCALYEHKVFVQGVIWGINSFDQCGIVSSPSLCESLVET